MPAHTATLARSVFFAGALLCNGVETTATSPQVSEKPAQGFLSAAPKAGTETKHLTLTTSASAATVAPGGRLTLFVHITPKPTMHVYSPEQKDVIPVAIALAPNDAVRTGKTTFPKPEKYFFAPLQLTQLVYSKPFRLAQEVTISEAPAVKGQVTVKGTLRYQACDEAICYLPQNVPVEWTIAIGK